MAQPDLADLLPSSENEKMVTVIAQLGSVRADLKRAEDDYIGKLIDGALYRRIKDQTEAELARPEHERVKLTSGAAVAGVTGSMSPAAAFDEADLATRRSVISDLCDVYLYPYPLRQEGVWRRNRQDRPEVLSGWPAKVDGAIASEELGVGLLG